MALIKTTEEFKNYSTVNANINYDTLKVFIEQAQILFLEDLLGQDQIDAIQSYIDVDKDPVDADLDLLIPYVNRCLVNYSLYLSVDHLAVNVGDAGITESNSQNSQSAPKFKLDALKADYLRQADLHAEKLLKFLESNADLTTYSEWFSSTAYTGSEGLIVSSALVASEDIDINQSRRIYRILKKRIKQIEAVFIKMLVGAGQYDDLVTQIKANTLKDSATNLALVEYLKPIISKKALFETIPFLKIGLTADGITIFSTSDGTTSKQAASKEDIKMLMHSLKDGYTGYEHDVQALKQFIIDNIDSYPLIEASTAYTSRPDPGPKRPPENLPTNKHFSV